MRWKLPDGRVLNLITPQELLSVPDGTELVAIDGDTVVKGRDKIDGDTRNGCLAFGFVVEQPVSSAPTPRSPAERASGPIADAFRHATGLAAPWQLPADASPDERADRWRRYDAWLATQPPVAAATVLLGEHAKAVLSRAAYLLEDSSVLRALDVAEELRAIVRYIETSPPHRAGEPEAPTLGALIRAISPHLVSAAADGTMHVHDKNRADIAEEIGREMLRMFAASPTPAGAETADACACGHSLDMHTGDGKACFANPASWPCRCSGYLARAATPLGEP